MPATRTIVYVDGYNLYYGRLKKTDVSLALQMYRDVNSGSCERIILVSNDSDAAQAQAALRIDFPKS